MLLLGVFFGGSWRGWRVAGVHRGILKVGTTIKVPADTCWYLLIPAHLQKWFSDTWSFSREYQPTNFLLPKEQPQLVQLELLKMTSYNLCQLVSSQLMRRLCFQVVTKIWFTAQLSRKTLCSDTPSTAGSLFSHYTFIAKDYKNSFERARIEHRPCYTASNSSNR